MAYLDSAPTEPVDQMPMPNGQDQPQAEEVEIGNEAQAEAQGESEAIQKLRRWSDPTQTKNIAEELEDDLLMKIGYQALEEYKIDDLSRNEWMNKTKDAMKLATQVAEIKTHPWPNASNVIFPLMTVAAIQFNARAYPAIVQGKNVVKGVVVGNDDGIPVIDPQTRQPLPDPRTGTVMWQVPPGEKQKRAQRIGEHMSYQLIDEQSEWEEDTDKLLLILPIVGCCFRKSYFSPELKRNVACLVKAEKLVVNYWAKDLNTAPRVSEEVEFYPNEIEEKKRAGIFLDKDYKAMSPGSEDKHKPIEFIEQHRLWDLDEDGYDEPYIITIHKLTGQVARIVAGFEDDGMDVEDDEVKRIQREHYYTKYDFIPNPDGGFYGVGFGKLLGPVNDTVNSILNMLIDAGTQQITGGGFIGRGFSIHGGTLTRKQGEWKYVNAPGGVIRDAIVPLQFPAPDQTLFALLGTMIESGKEISNVKDVLTGGGPSQALMQPTTLLALIEQGLKVFTAIFKRIYRSCKHEYEKLYRLNSIYLEDETSYQVGDDWRTITRQDYSEGAGVRPVADPTMVSDMQRLAHAQFLQGYQNDPYFNPHEVRKRVLDAAQTPDVDKLLVQQPAPNPELLARAAELEMKAQSEQVGQIKDLAQAVLYIAQADKMANQQDLDWSSHQLAVLKVAIENLTDAGQQQDQKQQQQGQPEKPPAPGARKAPDGFWYLPNPQIPGKYLRVVQGGQQNATPNPQGNIG